MVHPHDTALRGTFSIQRAGTQPGSVPVFVAVITAVASVVVAGVVLV